MFLAHRMLHAQPGLIECLKSKSRCYHLAPAASIGEIKTASRSASDMDMQYMEDLTHHPVFLFRQSLKFLSHQSFHQVCSDTLSHKIAAGTPEINMTSPHPRLLMYLNSEPASLETDIFGI